MRKDHSSRGKYLVSHVGGIWPVVYIGKTLKQALMRVNPSDKDGRDFKIYKVDNGEIVRCDRRGRVRE